MLKGRWLVLPVLAVCSVCAESASAASGDYIVVLKDSANPAAVEAKHQGKGAKIFKRYRHALKGYAANLSDAALAAVKADPQVQFISPNRTIKLPKPKAHCCKSPSQDPQEIGTGINRIDAESSTARSGDGKGKIKVNVAVVDDGVDPTQPELNVAGGFNCQGDDPNAWQAVGDHGTAVAGLIASQDNHIGEVGIAPGASIWSVRVFDEEGSGETAGLICAMDFVTASRLDKRSDNDIAVANLSGACNPGECDIVDDQNCGLTNGDAEHLAICRATAAGVVWVNSAGNESQDITCCLEPTYDEVLTVTAMGDYDGKPGDQVAPVCRFPGFDLEFDDSEFGQRDDQFAFFSNFATVAADRNHTVAAPGVCLKSTIPLSACTFPGAKTCYGSFLYGTSFSAPIASGTVALCIASGQCAGKTVPQIVSKIVADAAAYNTANPSYGFTGDPLHSPDPNKYYGFLIRAGLY